MMWCAIIQQFLHVYFRIFSGRFAACSGIMFVFFVRAVAVVDSHCFIILADPVRVRCWRPGAIRPDHSGARPLWPLLAFIGALWPFIFHWRNCLPARVLASCGNPGARCGRPAVVLWRCPSGSAASYAGPVLCCACRPACWRPSASGAGPARCLLCWRPGPLLCWSACRPPSCLLWDPLRASAVLLCVRVRIRCASACARPSACLPACLRAPAPARTHGV